MFVRGRAPRRTNTHTRARFPSFQVGRRWLGDVRCLQTRAGKHIIACSHLTCQNSRAPRLLVFGGGVELLRNKVKEDEMKNEMIGASQESHWGARYRLWSFVVL